MTHPVALIVIACVIGAGLMAIGIAMKSSRALCRMDRQAVTTIGRTAGHLRNASFVASGLVIIGCAAIMVGAPHSQHAETALRLMVFLVVLCSAGAAFFQLLKTGMDAELATRAGGSEPPHNEKR